MQRALADCQDRDLPQRHSRNQTQLREVPHSTAGIRSALTLNQVDNRSRNAITSLELRRRLTDHGDTAPDHRTRYEPPLGSGSSGPDGVPRRRSGAEIPALCQVPSRWPTSTGPARV